MIRFGYALLLAAALGVICIAVNYQRANRQPAIFLEALGRSCAKYGLHGYSALCHVEAAERWFESAGNLRARNSSAAGAATKRAARNFARAADTLEQAGVVEQAHNVRVRAAALVRDDADLQVRLLTDRARQDDVSARERLYQMAFRHNQPDALVAVADLLAGQGLNRDAASILRHANSKHPDRPESLLALAELLLREGDAAGAADHASRAAQLAADPATRARAWAVLARAGLPMPASERLRAESGRLVADYGATALGLLLYALMVAWPGLGALAARTGRRVQPSAI